MTASILHADTQFDPEATRAAAELTSLVLSSIDECWSNDRTSAALLERLDTLRANHGPTLALDACIGMILLLRMRIPRK